MKIAITGSSGFIGTALKAHLLAKGHLVTPIVRRASQATPAADAIVWDIENPDELGRRLEGVDAVIHLAGAGISDHRWSASYKREILESRVLGTQCLAKALAGMNQKPGLLISASAIGIYGPRGTEAVDELTGAGDDFLAKVCRNWEESALEAKKAGIRVAYLRTGLVLGKSGGALKKMLLPFQLGLGGIIGSGDQFYSWITLNDWLRAVTHLLENSASQGAYNLAAPGACSNRSYTKALGRALKRPTLFPMPAFAARLAFGEMADALLLSGQNVKPTRLLEERFRFEATSIDDAFKQVFSV